MDDGYYRVLISQDRDQTFITLAQYKGDYLDYLQGEPATNEAFLRMFLFGPYCTFVPHDMESFGSEISELLTYAGASALEAFERTSVVEPDHRPNQLGVPGGLQVPDDVGTLNSSFQSWWSAVTVRVEPLLKKQSKQRSSGVPHPKLVQIWIFPDSVSRRRINHNRACNAKLAE
ncbi:hypothetical protein GJ744_008542 [Endocarpon pusillum]|uniref:Uncharacterized protein n=1 Tax=Endocarpon pusillum TaxID=364733 RepID=A0A8H7AL37_9EURO|nr:hypothetical protein GJ744_008542 [Endocarpon pusillum]